MDGAHSSMSLVHQILVHNSKFIISELYTFFNTVLYIQLIQFLFKGIAILSTMLKGKQHIIDGTS